MNKPPMNMQDPNEHDWLDKILAMDSSYIEDRGFTERVIRQLPPARQHAPRAGILGCAILCAVAIFLLTAPEPAALYAEFVAFLYRESIFSLSALAIAIYTTIYWAVSLE
jgi:hypothetical protein